MLRHISTSQGILRASYVTERYGIVSLSHNPYEQVFEVTIHHGTPSALDFEIPCWNHKVVLWELERFGTIPPEVRDAIRRIDGNAIVLPAALQAAMVIIRPRPLSLNAVFLDSDGAPVGELRAGSVSAFEGAVGRVVSIPSEARRVLKNWTSHEPFWLAAIILGMPLLGSSAMSLNPNMLDPGRVIVCSLAASLAFVAIPLVALRDRIVWSKPLGRGRQAH